ncbi:DUF305 domain-containing protein [Rhizobium sp. GCM10022189]|uniref:CopM family metallochaperone n=1 Tax=Rhizobium sp. GCM10022189 TaxID=3252654 RepID=UPI00361DC3DA
MSLKIIALSALIAFAAPAFAEDMPAMDMSKHMGGHSPSSQAFTEANDRMHKDMMIKLSGDTDVDFVRSMIPHHQGAIDMAKIELQYGKDPEIRKLAEGVIKAQEAEIAEMNAWLKAHAK